MELLNKVVIITGGANGIGKECGLRLKKEGAKIIIADIDQDNGSIVEKTDLEVQKFPEMKF